MVYLSSLGSRASTVVVKYLGQWIRTSRILAEERPDVAFVMTPPVVAALPAFWYAWRHGKKVALDAHSAAFLHPRWRHFQWLQNALCRRAVTTLVHVEHIGRIVREAGGHATLVPDVPVTFPAKEPFIRPTGFVVAVVCSFNADEPLEAILDAARMTPDVQFMMTGNPRLFPARLAASMPTNTTLTGFLSIPAYGALISGVDAVMVLTTRDHTMLRGAYEAIYQGTPIIVSNWPILRAAFPEGSAHVDNTPTQISLAVRRIQTDLELYRNGAARLRDSKLRNWNGVRRTIEQRLQEIMAVGDRQA